LTIGHSPESSAGGSSRMTAFIVSTIDAPENGRRPAMSS
jgi:hypothetical protein